MYLGLLNYSTPDTSQSTFLTKEGKEVKDLCPSICCRSCSLGGTPLKLLSCVVLINHSNMTFVWLQPRGDVLGMQCLSTSPGAGGGVGGDGWRQVDSCMDRLETLNAVWCSAGGIYAPTAAGSGSWVYLAAKRSRRDEISKWSTCLKMHGIPQGWARATGYKSCTPAPGVKTGRECDT